MAGPKSNYITKQDMEIIEQAFQHRIDHQNQHIDKYGPLCTAADILAPTDRITDSFISQSRHYLPEVLDQQDCSSLHRFEYFSLEYDLNYCRGEDRRRYSDDSDEETELPWRRYWLSFDDDPPCSHPRMLLARFICLYDFLEMMPCQLAVTIRKMYPLLRLLYIVSLLVNYHHGDECKAYMYVAVKLCLKALQLSLYSLKISSYGVAKSLQYYCKLIHRYRLDDELVATAFKVFHVRVKINFVFLKNVLTLKYVLRALQKTRLKTNLLNNVTYGVLRNVDRCLFFLDEKFAELVEFGAISHYSEKDWNDSEELDAPKRRKLCPLNRQSEEQGCEQQIDPLSMLRSTQTFCLFLRSKNNENSRKEAEYTLKVLWASIPDPLQTQEKMAACLNKFMNLLNEYIPLVGRVPPRAAVFGNLIHGLLNFIQTTPRYKEYLLKSFYENPETTKETWQWYKAIVLKDGSPLDSPRSLRHLSRCAVRHRLGMNFQLPNGVQSLNLDIKLKGYLLLKECGLNPFEDEEHLKKKLIDLYS